MDHVHLFKSLTAAQKPAGPCICLICVFMVSMATNYVQTMILVLKGSVLRLRWLAKLSFVNCKCNIFNIKVHL